MGDTRAGLDRMTGKCRMVDQEEIAMGQLR